MAYGGKNPVARVRRLEKASHLDAHDPLDPRIRREPTGLNAPVLLCAILYWALGGSWDSLRTLFSYGTLNYYVSRFYMRRYDTDIESSAMMALSWGPTIITVLSMWISAGHFFPTWREVGLALAAALGMLLSGPPIARQDEYEQAMLEALEATGGVESAETSNQWFGAFRNKLLLSELRKADAHADRKSAKERKVEAREKRKEANREQRRARREM